MTIMPPIMVCGDGVSLKNEKAIILAMTGSPKVAVDTNVEVEIGRAHV